MRKLGGTNAEVSMLGLGGHRLLATTGRFREAQSLILRALDLGLTYFDTARIYGDSEAYLGSTLGPRRRQVFLATKTHARDRVEAMVHLEESLARLRTDYIDLWQVHDVRTQDDVSQIFGPSGSMEALIAAKHAGKTRFLGVTGHANPEVIQDCLTMFEFDVVMVPVNPAEPHHRSFLDSVIPLAQARKVGLVAMYLYCGGRVRDIPGFRGIQSFLRFGLSQGVDVALVGCDTIAQLEDNARHATEFVPMPFDEQRRLIDLVRPHAHLLLYYKC